MDTSAVAALKAQARGEVILPGDENYDKARTVYNAMINKRPSIVIRCADVTDVIAPPHADSSYLRSCPREGHAQRLATSATMTMPTPATASLALSQ